MFRSVALQRHAGTDWTTVVAGFTKMLDAELLEMLGLCTRARPMRLVVDRVIVALSWINDGRVEVVLMRSKIAIKPGEIMEIGRSA